LYEVMSASGQSLSLPEDVDIPVDVILDHSVPAPADTTIQAHGSLFPLSAVGTANLLAPEPRFMDLNAGPPMQQIDAFDFNGTCATTLLFPYITNQAGFDTGLVISNTSMDPMGTAAQHGTCSLNYYGFVGNHLQVPLLTDTVIKGLAVTPDIPSGGQLILSLSGGGGFVDPMGTTSAVACTNCSPAGQFQGYMIATCNFQYAHGYAFISDLGATKLAQGYLALVIPRRHQVLGVGDRATASHAFNPKQNQGETLGN
jgi:hypothetical protein